MSVSDILREMAQNAGRARLQRGSIIGQVVADATQVPGQMLADRDRSAAIVREQARQDELVGIRRGEANRQSEKDKADALAEAEKAKRQDALRAGIVAGFGDSGDVSKFDVNKAAEVVTAAGYPDLVQTLAETHKKLQPEAPKTREIKTTDAMGNPVNNIVEDKPGQSFPVPQDKVTFSPPTSAKVNGKNAFVRAGSDGKTYDLSGKMIDPSTIEPESKAPAVGTFEDYVTRKFGPSPTPAQIESARVSFNPQQPAKGADQNKLEQEYRTVLARGLSSRSGGLGLEDAKVQQANHLIALMDAAYDPKTDSYNIPRVQQTELAMGLAKLVAPGGVVGVQMEKEINQRTAKGDLAGALTYLTGTPLNGAPQDIVKMYRDSILRQGQVSQENREGEMRYLRGLAPTELDEERRKKLEATSLNPLRQSRIIRNIQTGEKKLQVSTDGGATWK